MPGQQTYSYDELYSRDEVDALLAGIDLTPYMPKSGGTFTGNVGIGHAPGDNVVALSIYRSDETTRKFEFLPSTSDGQLLRANNLALSSYSGNIKVLSPLDVIQGANFGTNSRFDSDGNLRVQSGQTFRLYNADALELLKVEPTGVPDAFYGLRSTSGTMRARAGFAEDSTSGAIATTVYNSSGLPIVIGASSTARTDASIDMALPTYFREPVVTFDLDVGIYGVHDGEYWRLERNGFKLGYNQPIKFYPSDIHGYGGEADTRLRRTAANTLTLDDGAGGAASLNVLGNVNVGSGTAIAPGGLYTNNGQPVVVGYNSNTQLQVNNLAKLLTRALIGNAGTAPTDTGETLIVGGTGRFVAPSDGTGDILRLYGNGGSLKWAVNAYGGANQTHSGVTVSVGVNDGAGYVGTTSNHDTDFYTNNTIKGKVTTGGRWLLGSTLPTDDGASALQVNGDVKASRLILGGGSDTGEMMIVDGILRTVSLSVNGNQVIGAQQGAIADATDYDTAITQLNSLLAALRTHGLIAA